MKNSQNDKLTPTDHARRVDPKTADTDLKVTRTLRAALYMLRHASTIAQ